MRVSRHAAPAPTTIPVASDSSSVNANTGKSRRTAIASGSARPEVGDDQLHRRARHEESDDAAGDAQHRGLAQDLSKHPAATGPEREAHADLLPASDRPRQYQVRDVRARDEEHERDGAQENHQRRPDIGNQILVQRNDHRSPALVVFGILLLETTRDDRHLRVRRLQIDVAAQPGDDRGVVVVADGALLIGPGQRRPQLRIIGEVGTSGP